MQKYFDALDNLSPFKRHGKVIQTKGMVIEATCPDTYIGEICEIHPKFGRQTVITEVVAIKENRVLLMPYQKIKGISQGSLVNATGNMAMAKVGKGLLGRVIDAFGEPLDSKGNIQGYKDYPLYQEPINPMSRSPITAPIDTGIKAIDNFITFGRGQRIGLFAGSGVGKSTLLSTVSNNLSEDINVIALIGERGREVEEFVNASLGEKGMENSVVIAATAEQPPLIRAHAVYNAMAIAEYFSKQGKNVLFILDSITRFALALREIGLSIGEPPTVKGFTPSVFSEIPSIIERCGMFKGRGAISAIFSVLVEGDDFNDPVVDCVRAILDGHIVLTRELADRNHYPAIDVLKSVSRLFRQLNNHSHLENVGKAKSALTNYIDNKELIDMGAMSDTDKSEAIVEKWLELEAFLKQTPDDLLSVDQSKKMLMQMFS
ncbi:FliI/YscN family ATPase [Catenovulum sp. SM1970]|uniref:FliI/YscN family ATPase n=1 Tax=Marinifaba aquimaris TaxID=2741323 RepID=UPI001572CDC0|nr:FliI/YscN family ATPase [Marinifaba aquimaris]NTS77383.1 FliI/YscN family ATPase [Marinifaba aquimaris]